jgi:hypothetical protein
MFVENQIFSEGIDHVSLLATHFPDGSITVRKA